MSLQETPCCADQFAAFIGAHRSCAAAEACMTTIADLDEYQRIGIAHDEVEFSEAAVPVAFDQFQPRTFKVLLRALFEARADGAGSHDPAGTAALVEGCASRPAAIGRAIPPWNCTQIGVRSTCPKASIVSCPVAPGT